MSQSPTRPCISVMITVRLTPLPSQTPSCYRSWMTSLIMWVCQVHNKIRPKGCWQVPLTCCASEISAYVTPDNFLQYIAMPYGLKSAPATFQRLMSTVLCGVGDCEVYFDDLVAYSSTWTKHVITRGGTIRVTHDSIL